MAKHDAQQNYTRTALIVGADHLGTTPAKLAEEGVNFIHGKGRNPSFKSKIIPAYVDMIILYWDYINHPLMQSVKKQAKARGIPLIYSRCKGYLGFFLIFLSGLVNVFWFGKKDSFDKNDGLEL